MADDALDPKTRFGETISGIRRAMRRHPDPSRLTVVLLTREQADELTAGIAVERVVLRGEPGEPGELVLQMPGEPVPRLIGWSPTRRPTRKRHREERP
jgi:hypothetical protein